MLPLHGLLCCKLVLLLSHWANTEREREKETVGCSSSRLVQRELLARCAVPRGILEETPVSPTHQGFEVALRVRRRSFYEWAEPSLGNESQAQARSAFFQVQLCLGLVWSCLRRRGYAEEGAPFYLCNAQMWHHLCDNCPAGMWLCPSQALGCRWTSCTLALTEGEKCHLCIFSK